MVMQPSTSASAAGINSAAPGQLQPAHDFVASGAQLEHGNIDREHLDELIFEAVAADQIGEQRTHALVDGQHAESTSL